MLIVFAIADVLTALALCWLIIRNRDAYQVRIERLSGPLTWGSLNAMLRSLPRLSIFMIGEKFYSSEAIIELRLLLQPRENLAKVMGIVNVVFFREILQRDMLSVFSILFSMCFAFQIGFVILLNALGMPIVLSSSVLMFYGSASLVYGLTQAHWKVVGENQDLALLLISAIAFAALLIVATLALALSLPVSMLILLAVFNGVWSTCVLAHRFNFMRATQVACEESHPKTH